MRILALVLACFFVSAAQATIIDFQSLEHVDSGQAAVPVTPFFYTETGYDFTSSSPTYSLTTWGTLNANYLGSTALWNGDGTGSTGITTLTRSDGGAFNLLSMDIGELNVSGSGVASVTFDGILNGGGNVSTTFITDGIRSTGSGFEAFNFSGFNNLTSVSWLQVVPYIQFDNVNVEAIVPLPGTIFLFSFGLLGLLGVTKRQQISRTVLTN